MANTIWKEVFLIMCSSSRKNARNTERFPLSIHITDDYALQHLCGEQHNVCNDEGKLNGSALNRAIYAEPAEKEMTYGELVSAFREAERSGKHMEGFVVFTEDSFKESYPEATRTYCISSNNKAFQPHMGGYSIYGSALDGSDPMVRLERYMAAEKGGEDGWKIERCYIKENSREMLDIIAGTCFICDCSGESFGSLTEEQANRYAKQFKLPENFIRSEGEIHAIPFKPMEESMER